MKYKIITAGEDIGRIKALKDFKDVSKGDLGGFVKSYENLSQEGSCWVFGDAEVYGDARVYGNAEISGNAKVYGDARVYDNVEVSGNAEIYGDVRVYDNIEVYGNAKVYGDARAYGNASVFGNAQVYETARVYGNAEVDGEVAGDVEVYGSAEIVEEVARPEEGKKYDEDKPDHTLVAKELLDAVARAKGFGAGKYGRNNFLGGMSWTRILASTSRHLHAFIDGEDNDPESGLSHMDHAAACLEMLLVYMNRGLGKDDRFKKED